MQTNPPATMNCYCQQWGTCELGTRVGAVLSGARQVIYRKTVPRTCELLNNIPGRLGAIKQQLDITEQKTEQKTCDFTLIA